MKKRLIDIYPFPPREASAPDPFLLSQSQKGRSVSWHFGGVWGVGFFLAIIFSVWMVLVHTFFTRAEVQVWPQGTRLDITEYFFADRGEKEMDLERRIIRARLFEKEAELSLRFPSTGSTFKEERAQGIIQLFNGYSTQPQTLVADTRLVSEDGRIFRLEDAVSLPGTRLEGKRMILGTLDVRVRAAEPGPEYNIGPSKFSLPGLVGTPGYTKIFGESFQAMAGGIAREVPVVSEEDITLAKEELQAQLRAKATQELLANIPHQFQILEDSLTTSALQDNSLVKPGVELNEFTFAGRLKVSTVGLYLDDADTLGQHLLQEYVAPNEIINKQSVRLTPMLSEEFKSTSLMPMKMRIQAERYEKLDAKLFTKRIAGLSRGQFRELMKDYPFLAKVEFSLWPPWISTVPKDEGRLKIEVLLKEQDAD